ncbi:MAG: beta-Ala-His dipeptidase [Clostridia bacterium]|nr:beta-Ala-His dipeptidase [Clostridia bacterium]
MSTLMEPSVSSLPARYFTEIAAIPRASGHEAGIADYLESFAAARGLACYRDASCNVLIKKQGSKGREHEPALLLQAHTDMVTEVAYATAHDFSKEGVNLQREGNILSAKGTTLGADDGFGVALLLAALDGAADSHPPLECLFTASEEVGLLGAAAFDYERISARRMLNFDTSEEHLIITGCCGGIRSDLILPVTLEKGKGEGLKLTLHGLCGGHSGSDIDKGRANALVIMGKILENLQKHTPFRTVSLTGGDKDNAIPRDCEAVILPADLTAAKRFLSDTDALLSSLTSSPEDAGCALTVTDVTVSHIMTERDSRHILDILGVRNGVFYRRTDGIDCPETSRNLARVRTEKGEVSFGFSSRSPFPARIKESTDELDALAARVGGRTRHYAGYPGWEGAPDSPVSTLWQRAYRATTGREICATVIHAGLECGLISDKIPNLDVISVGCNIYDLHTPAERMELDSFERVYQTLLTFLREC